MTLEERITALEQRFNRLEDCLKKQLDLYRAIQIEDETEIRRIYEELARIKPLLNISSRGQ